MWYIKIQDQNRRIFLLDEECPYLRFLAKNARNFTQIFSYDTAFMFACVNADYAKWLVKKHADGEIEILDLLWTNKARLKIGICLTQNSKYFNIFIKKRLRSVNVS